MPFCFPRWWIGPVLLLHLAPRSLVQVRASFHISHLYLFGQYPTYRILNIEYPISNIQHWFKSALVFIYHVSVSFWPISNFKLPNIWQFLGFHRNSICKQISENQCWTYSQVFFCFENNTFVCAVLLFGIISSISIQVLLFDWILRAIEGGALQILLTWI